MPEELWTEVHNTVQKSVTTREALSVTKIIQKKKEKKKKTKKCKKINFLSEEALHIAEERCEAKSKRKKKKKKKGKLYPTEYNFRE